ncbi:MAG: tRNA (adenosine(37)-N6)-threonylcarbamoyltransferase complex dimerization subunit type 1 TsaB [Clostridia bacterium]|nr:tRNA (adenosine(37)-N6)-threonylcarbamoyltransferase complex dimerization subunit type 1 TsaB [Clostridia bacterium]
MKILSVDSSSVSASVAITENGVTLAENFINNGLTHSQTLMPMVEKTLNDANISAKDIELFAITNGPGSFTGVRIGIASIKGMADALNKKCVAISTLEAIAEPLKNEDCIACAVMDARCNQVYTAMFESGKRLCEDKAVLIDELGQELKNYNKKVVFIGDGSVLCYEKLKDVVTECEVAYESIRYIHASSIGRIAEEKVKNGEMSINSENLVPFYLRLPQAERELNNKKSLKKENIK